MYPSKGLNVRNEFLKNTFFFPTTILRQCVVERVSPNILPPPPPMAKDYFALLEWRGQSPGPPPYSSRRERSGGLPPAQR